MRLNFQFIGIIEMVKFMSYSEAMEIVNAYGCQNDCNSLIDCISAMEDNYDLSANQRVAMNIVLGEYVRSNGYLVE